MRTLYFYYLSQGFDIRSRTQIRISNIFCVKRKNGSFVLSWLITVINSYKTVEKLATIHHRKKNPEFIPRGPLRTIDSEKYGPE